MTELQYLNTGSDIFFKVNFIEINMHQIEPYKTIL